MRCKGYRQSQNRILDTCPMRQAFQAPKASRMLQRSLLTSGHGSLLAEGTTPSTVTRTLLLTVRREGTACVHSWDTTVLSSACWSGRGWATCELSCHRHREQVLETPAKQQGKEYEAPNFRCKCKSLEGQWLKLWESCTDSDRWFGKSTSASQGSLLGTVVHQDLTNTRELHHVMKWLCLCFCLAFKTKPSQSSLAEAALHSILLIPGDVPRIPLQPNYRFLTALLLS